MDVDKALTLLAGSPNADLDIGELALLLARDEYPSLDVAGYLAELTAMAHEIRQKLKGGLESRLAVLRRYLFHDLGFYGNAESYYDPRNSYLNEVMDRRTGLPIALSALTMAVGRRAGLELAGVGLPGHFIAKMVAGKRAILFDPFHGGRILTTEACEQLVKGVTGQAFAATPEIFQAVPLGVMTTRMLNNLKVEYLRTADYRRAVRVMERLRQLNPTDPLQQRDLGAAMLRAGQAGKAIDNLQGYLERVPFADDREEVATLVAHARREIAGWN